MTTPSIRVRITNIEHTIVSPPSALLDRTSLPRAPVISIFGISSEGLKACVHVHEVFPYFYVEYSGSMEPAVVTRYISKLTHSLNHAIAISMRKDPSHPKSVYVRSILLTKGVHFYGYHTTYVPFLKILLADPTLVNRASTILQAGSVMRTVFRTFEVHLGYILQFMCDFGLYGCGWLDIGSDAWMRGNVEVEEDFDTSKFHASPNAKTTHLPLEFDIPSHQILNRHLILPRPLPSTPLPPVVGPTSFFSTPLPLVQSVRELWEDERQRRISKGLSPSPELPFDGSAGTRGSGGGWRSSERMQKEIEERIKRERLEIEEHGVPKGRDKTWERWVMSTLESVEGHWEKAWRTWKPGSASTSSKVPGKEQAVLKEEENPYETPPKQGDNVEEDVDEELMSSQQLQEWFTQAEKEERGREREIWDEFVEGDTAGVEDWDSLNAQQGGTPRKNIKTPTPSPTVKPRYPDLSSSSMTSGIMHTPSRSDRSFPSETKKRKQNPFGEKEWLTTPSKKMRPGDSSSSEFLPLLSPRQQRSPRTPMLGKGSFPTSGNRRKTPTTPGKSTSSTFSMDVVPTVLDPNHDEPGQGILLADLPHSSAIDDEIALKGSGAVSQKEEKGWANLRWNSSFVSSFSLSQDIRPSSEDRALFNSTTYIYNPLPPATSYLFATLTPSKLYRDPYYSNRRDVPVHSKEYAGRTFQIRGGTALEEWKGDSRSVKEVIKWGRLTVNSVDGWEYAARVVPGRREIDKWLEMKIEDAKEKFKISKNGLKERSQIEGPTQPNTYGFKISQKKTVRTSNGENRGMSVLALEVLASSRRDLLPDPQTDSDQVLVLFYCFQTQQGIPGDASRRSTYYQGIIAVNSAPVFGGRIGADLQIDLVEDELALINKCIDTVQELDPDVLCGWELQNNSWGYLSDRAKFYGMSFSDQVSRALPTGPRLGTSENWELTHNSTFKTHGRHVFNVWRIMRVEQTLTSYTFENVVFHVLRRRIPRYSSRTLMDWFRSPIPARTTHVLCYMQERTATVIDMLDETEVITKNSEFARVFGVDFFSVLSRGSQFKVESFMFRIAKPENFVLLSPSKQDVGKQNAAECIPLIMEPQSQFYKSPLIVLDFQSLYPSIMIAYNYCYSTCLGRIDLFKGQNKLGVTELDNSPGLLESLKDHIIVAPNGIVYAKPTVRKSLLAEMLQELLETRIMVKQAMKSAKGDKALLRILDARQLSLKFICNVTYGYTSASYSGRMPCVEIADSIVESGRETLEKAIHLIDHTAKWGAKVVYGDTDSLFISLPGKTKEEAFRIGRDMADTITSVNPPPVKLKFEKVYFPCVLMAKKRYVGFKYESPDDLEPVFDAKGIETIRRDGIPAGQKMVESCLKMLFRHQDLSEIKSYCQRSWLKLLEGRVSIQDFIFSKEVRLGTYSDKVAPPPGAMVAARRLAHDPRAEAQYGDRVPYVITRGGPKDRLVDRAFGPEEMFWREGDGKTPRYLDAQYYILNQLIPPLCRIFDLVGADVRGWYNEMPKSTKADKPDSVVVYDDQVVIGPTKPLKGKIDNHFRSMSCLVCGEVAVGVICQTCQANRSPTIYALMTKLHSAEAQLRDTQQTCTSCCALPPTDEVPCESYDCPWVFERYKAEKEAARLRGVWRLVRELDLGYIEL